MTSQLTPEMQIVLEQIRRYEATIPDPFDFEPHVGRAINQLRGKYWNVSLPDVAAVRCTTVHPNPDLKTGRMNVISFIPPEARPGAIVYAHGGGWAFSPPTFEEHFARALAMESRMPVLAIDYGLAPERQFPGPVHDVVSAWRTIAASPGRFGAEPGPLILSGDSAGANLALAAMLHEQAAEKPLPAAAVLIYGVYHYDPASPSMLRYSDVGPSSKQMQAFWDWYAPGPITRYKDALAAPLLATDRQLAGLPPMALLVAEIDSLATDSELLARRLAAVGRKDLVFIEAGVVHGFLQMGTRLEAARRCMTTISGAITTLTGA